MTFRNATRAVLLTVVVAVLALAAPGPASAHQWTEPSSWANSHTLGQNYLDRGSVVALWQRMVHVQFGGGCAGTHGCTYRTDGVFGTNTHNRTILWQAVYRDNLVPGLAVDGIVGPQTWNAARFFNLHRVGENTNFVFHDYGPNDSVYERGFSMPYAKGFATWLAEGWGCDAEIIDHPTVRDTWLRSCY
jgi:hypothetical protein